MRSFSRLQLFSAGLLFVTLTLVTAPGQAREAPGRSQLSLDDLRTFTDVLHLVRSHYVDEMGDRQLLDAALHGVLDELDPHSRLLSSRQARLQDEDAMGHYGGIGIEVEIRNGRIRVFEVIPESPAWHAGVKVDDLILAVDGVPVKGRPLMQSFRALHGEPGSEVEVTFQTPGMDSRTLSFERIYIPVLSVKSELLEDRIAYFRLTHFHAGSAKDLEAAFLKLDTDAGTRGLAGIVLDLRDNPGGVVQSATEIADGFLDDGLVVYTRGRYPASHLEFHAKPGQWAPDLPMAVLINELSASAAEILAGALKDNERARLFGQPSFGKGTVQSVIPMRNGTALKLTTARYYTPSGRSIDKVGIQPDVEIDDGQENQSVDAVLEAAIRHLVDRGDSEKVSG